ncbi:prolipoprotein diacylglyceryl transferase [Candidatus Woesearchaeota archaeon]|nr:prolipoprotein diacylglyceryl transferase [Candidatus Woesearchaeota archaeon]
MFYNNIDPVLLRIGYLEIRYYGIIYALGFVIAYYFLLYFVKNKKLKLSSEEIADLLFYLLIGIVIGARLFEVLFYNLPYFIQNPVEIFKVWHGGLSFHGGLVGAVVAALIFCRKKKLKFYALADAVVFPLSLALALGRIGNFINGELYGTVTSVPWCVKFRGIPSCRHPSQLYESFKNLLIFGILWFIKDDRIEGKKLPPGFLFWTFVVLYALFRFAIESFKEPIVQLGFFSMGELLCIVMFGVGVVFMWKLFKKP